ncbi:MAG TPA: RES family NAD+ phosphorylase [Bryobacteraceae bacterium]|nr:RES family NAD+ phosphorylase [Bryobacteraceae bacterium]
MTDLPVRAFDWENSHRLIPSRYSETGTVLSPLAGSNRELDDLVLLDGATNDRVQAEQRGSIGISTFELVYAIPNAHVVNAAYTHPNESGSRFNDHTRGAWYAADSQKASIAEVVYHKSRRLSEIIVPDAPYQRPPHDVSTFDDWLANFRADFHVLEPREQFPQFLEPEPVPQCYAASQALARDLLNAGSNGLVYPSVRYRRAQCIACFRPALVYNPHRSQRLEIAFTANKAGYSTAVRRVPF